MTNGAATLARTGLEVVVVTFSTIGLCTDSTGILPQLYFVLTNLVYVGAVR